MALLQISEPGGKLPKPDHRRAVGIDLGTTNSLVAAKCGTGVEVLRDTNGQPLVPSIVHYADTSNTTVGNTSDTTDTANTADAQAVAVGNAVTDEQLIADPANTIVSVKRLLGKSLPEIQTQYPHLPYQFDETRPSQSPALITSGGSKDPIEVSADILRHLKARAESSLRGTVEGAVITVPAYFNDAQRQQTKDAAERADLHVLRLLNEPTAAAVAYGLDSGDEGKVLVFDLGGGTFDVSLLRLSKGVFEVLATGGDTNLGGDDFDQAIVAWAQQQYTTATEANGQPVVQTSAQTSVQTNGQPNSKTNTQKSDQTDSRKNNQEQAQLRLLARAARHELSEVEHAKFTWREQVFSLTRTDFAALAEPLISRTLLTCRRVLRDAELEPQDVDNIIMVGGATRMPAVREAVATLFKRELLASINPDQVVAIGAAIQADVLVGNKSANDFLLLDVTPLSLGIETMGELVEKIIPRNTTIPVARSQEFTTFKDGQSAMSLHVLQGERELVSDCRSLARFELRGIPPMVAGAAKIRVTFQVDADGLLGVTAEELGTAQKAEIQIKPSYGLNADAIEQMLEASQDHAEADMHTRALKEAEIEARQLIAALRAAQEVDRNLMSAAEHASMDAAVAKLEQAIENADTQAIRTGTEQLNEASGEFAARRMNAHIARALKGKAIDNMKQAE
ncbi:MAG: molecular chaperone HscA [Pseudohongiellaceae bacterium]